MEIRLFKNSDTSDLIELFRNTVHTVCKRDYSVEQLNTWAPKDIDAGKWATRFINSYTVVAEHEGQLAGFANLEANGCIDMFYVGASHQRQGVGSLLFEALESEAKIRGLKRLYSDVSITARQFFLSKEFVVEREYSKNVGAVTFPNTMMAKQLR
jgi:GNAT superfamily N-acetyltransferase